LEAKSKDAQLAFDREELAVTKASNAAAIDKSTMDDATKRYLKDTQIASDEKIAEIEAKNDPTPQDVAYQNLVRDSEKTKAAYIKEGGLLQADLEAAMAGNDQDAKDRAQAAVDKNNLSIAGLQLRQDNALKQLGAEPAVVDPGAASPAAAAAVTGALGEQATIDTAPDVDGSGSVDSSDVAAINSALSFFNDYEARIKADPNDPALKGREADFERAKGIVGAFRQAQKKAGEQVVANAGV
jgi:hypothetical protein